MASTLAQARGLAEGASLESGAPLGRRYAAFISYSHADEEVGAWLHRRLENSRIPRSSSTKFGLRQLFGERLGKVFRDQIDLAAANDLGAEIRRSLEQSDALIVLCSPRARASAYVNEEVRYFKQLGRGNRIFAAIVDGEPYAAGKPGFTSEDECFPQALLMRVDDRGELTAVAETSEPLAADLRAPRRREEGALKIIAGIIGVGLDELVQRERTAQQWRMRAVIGLAVAFLAFAVVATGSAIQAMRDRSAAVAARSLAESERDKAKSAIARVFAERAWAAMERGETARAARYALAGYSIDPDQEHQSTYRNVLARVLFEAGAAGTAIETGSVTALEVSPSRDKFVVGAGIRSAVYNTDGTLVAQLEARDEAVVSVSFRADGQQVILGYFDNVAESYDTRSGRRIARLPLEKRFPGDWVDGAFLTADGRFAITQSTDRIVRVWNAPSATIAYQFPAGAASGLGIAYDSSTGHAAVSLWQRVVIWDVATRAIVREIALPVDTTLSTLRFASNGRTLAGTVLTLDGSNVYLMNPATGALRIVETHEGNLTASRFSADGSKLITATGSGHARVWDVNTGAALEHFQIGSPVFDADLSSDGTKLVTAGRDRVVRVWDTRSDQLIASMSGHEGEIAFVRFGAGGAIVTGGYDHTLRVWDASSSLGRIRMASDAPLRLAIASPTDRVVVGLSMQGRAIIWRADTGAQLMELPRDAGEIAAVAFLPDGTLLAGSRAGFVRLWRIAGSSVSAVGGFDAGGPLYELAASPNGRLLLTKGDGVAKVWAVRGFNLERAIPFEGLVSASFNAASDRVLLSGLTSIGSFSLADGGSWSARVAAGSVVAFSPDGRRAAITLGGQAARILDLEHNREIARTSVDAGEQYTAISWTPSGRQLLTGSLQGSVQFWDPSSGHELRRAARHESAISALLFSANEDYLISGAQGEYVAISDMQSGREVLRINIAPNPGDTDVALGAAGRLALIRQSEYGGDVVQGSVLWAVNLEQFNRPWGDLLPTVCTRLLSREQQHFTTDEIANDPLLREFWISDGAADRSVCLRTEARG